MNSLQSVLLSSINQNTSGSTRWASPSNIALVKYWGKKGFQLPANASLSFTLSACKSITSLAWELQKDEKPHITFLFEGKENPAFAEKSLKFIQHIEQYMPWLKQVDLHISSENTFPHSSGIASSASGMSALALCLVDAENQILGNILTENQMLQRASFLSRIGSGSACRSLFSGLAAWGVHPDIENSSDEFAVGLSASQVHPDFLQWQDVVLLVDKGQKKVSSTLGHSLLNNNPYAAVRYADANKNISKLLSALKNRDYTNFINIVEHEALSLHALMMTSNPYFILMRPNTLAIIEAVWRFREQTQLPVCFTLDAGANVHLLFADEAKQKVMEFVDTQLACYCENLNYICDCVGTGPKKQ